MDLNDKNLFIYFVRDLLKEHFLMLIFVKYLLDLTSTRLCMKCFAYFLQQIHFSKHFISHSFQMFLVNFLTRQALDYPQISYYSKIV